MSRAPDRRSAVVTVLWAGRARLILEPDENEWCQVILESDRRRLNLGADMKSTVCERLRRALVDDLEGPASGRLDGVDVRWVLSLAELHSTVYVGGEAGLRLLFVQAADGSVVSKMRLDPRDVRRWDELLTPHALR